MPTNQIHATPEIIEEEKVCTWLGSAMPGEFLVYHRGMLSTDTAKGMSKLPEAQRAKLVRIAALARQASTDTLVHLVQRRHDVNDYSYLMIARPRPSHLVTAVFDTRLAAA